MTPRIAIFVTVLAAAAEIGEIKFSGKGCTSGSDIAISGQQVAFFCRR